MVPSVITEFSVHKRVTLDDESMNTLTPDDLPFGTDYYLHVKRLSVSQRGPSYKK